VNASIVGNIVIGLAVLGLLISRQVITRPVREHSAARIFLILGVIGLVETIEALHPKGSGNVNTMGLLWLVASLLVAGALGIVRAQSVHIWQNKAGVMLMRGTAITMLLWLVAIAIHFAFEYAIDHATHASTTGSATILLYLAVSLGVQRETVRLRAAKMRAETPIPSEAA